MSNNKMNVNPSPINQTYSLNYCSDKQTIFQYYCKYTFTRTQSMFVYEGLPETIPVQYLEKYLQQNGSCCIAKVDGDLYALIGSAGGEYDEYYQPTKYTVANPYLNLSKTYTINEDCVYCKNDYEANGLTPLISRYCGLMTENLLTIRLSDINMRMMSLLSAPDDNTLESAKQYLKNLENGSLGVVGESPFFDGLKLQSNNIGSGDYMIQFIELHQYLKGSMYNELGINSNFNMKREALSGEEVALNDDALTPLIDDMLKQRRIMCSQLNEMFGLNVSVDYGSAWHSNVVEKQLVGEEELGGNNVEAAEMGGDESSLPADESANLNVDELDDSDEVSRLKENENDDENSNSNSPNDNDKSDEGDNKNNDNNNDNNNNYNSNKHDDHESNSSDGENPEEQGENDQGEEENKQETSNKNDEVEEDSKPETDNKNPEPRASDTDNGEEDKDKKKEDEGD